MDVLKDDDDVTLRCSRLKNSQSAVPFRGITDPDKEGVEKNRERVRCNRPCRSLDKEISTLLLKLLFKSLKLLEDNFV